MPHRSTAVRKVATLQLLLFILSLSSFAQTTGVIHPKYLRPEFRGIRLQHIDRPGHPKVGLVLSGGGGRGLAQIGVLRALERNHIPIDLIVGNSLGSVIGGLYASGYTITQIESIAAHTNWNELLSFSEETKRTDLFVGQKESQQEGYLVIRFDGLEPIIPSSISSGQRLSNFFSYLSLQALYHPNPSFDDLRIPFRATATDLLSGKRIILDHGSLAEAMRASITVPLLYSPLEKDSMYLVDGGLTSNIPVDVAKSLGCDVIITVNSTSSMRSAGQMSAPWEIADQIMTIMMQEGNQRQLTLADVVITPYDGNRVVSDFTGIDSLIASGEWAGEQSIEAIRNVIHNRSKTSSSLSEDSVSSATVSYPPLDSIEFSGDHLVSHQLIEQELVPFKGKELRYEDVQHAMENILSLYRQKGYSLARIESMRVDPERGSLDFVINEGTIKQIRYEGNERTRDYIIRREFPLDEGNIFTIDQATQGLTNIKSTGLFEYVLLDVRYSGNQPVIVLKVKEKSAELLRFGLHADNEHSFVTTVDIRDANFRGAWEDLGLTLQYGYRDRSAQLGYTINRIFHTYLTTRVSAYFTSRDVITYRDDLTLSSNNWDRIEDGKYKQSKYGWSLNFGTHLERFGDLTAELRMERQRIVAISGQGYQQEDYHFVGLRLQSTIDTEDKFLFPTKGMNFNFSYESAARQLGSDVGFGKVNFTYETYFTLLPRHTIRPKLTFGFADETLPISEQFRLGGFNSFFGLHEDDSYGRQLFVINMEYRYWLPFKIIFETYLKVRYDLGTVSLVPQELKLNNFRHGVGVELDLDTPLGATAFGVGQSFYSRLDLTNAPLSVGPLLFYISVGPGL